MEMERGLPSPINIPINEHYDQLPPNCDQSTDIITKHNIPKTYNPTIYPQHNLKETPFLRPSSKKSSSKHLDNTLKIARITLIKLLENDQQKILSK